MGRPSLTNYQRAKMSDEKELLSRLPDASAILAGPIMAFAISLLRALYDSREPRRLRIFLEALICAGLTVGVMAAVLLLLVYLSVPIPDQYLTFVAAGVGSFVGFIGAFEIRRLILKFLNIQITGKS